METKVNIQQNKIIHLEHSMVMYGSYTAETLEKLINTVIKYIMLQPQMKDNALVN